jgi:hypothetical protein
MAVIVTAVEVLTVTVVTVKVAVVLPAATVTDAGTLAAAALVVREMDTPPTGAAPLRVRVPVLETPPVTLVGVTATEERDTETDVMVSAAVLLTPL